MNLSLPDSMRSLLAPADEQLMWRVQTKDDAQAFARLVERWQRPICQLCQRLTGDAHGGEDLAQETFTRLFVKRRDYKPTAKFSTYLWRIAINQCYDELRRRQRLQETSLETDPEEMGPRLDAIASTARGPDQTLIDEERNAFVRQGLMQLPEYYRVVVVLRHYENLKFREIAEVLDIPEGTVKSRLAEALNQLHRWFTTQRMDERNPSARPARTPKEMLIL